MSQHDRSMFIAPTLALALLVGMAVETAGPRAAPADLEPYHTAAAAAVNSIPTRVGSWSARREDVPREAIALLKPNAILCLKYVDNDATQPRSELRWASLLVDQ